MLEKSGLIPMTSSDFLSYEQGQVPERLQKDWGIFSIDELRGIVDNNQFQLVGLEDNE